MRNYIPLLLFVIIGADCRLEAQCLVTSITINTAYNPITGSAIAFGLDGQPPVTDPKWVLTAVSPGVATALPPTLPYLPAGSVLIEVIPGNSADIIQPAPGGWASNPLGNPGGYISCFNGKWYVTDITTDYNMTLGRPFRMCSDDSVTFDLYISSDDWTSSTNIDGTIPLSFSQPAGYNPPNYSLFHHFSQTVYLTCGLHTLNFIVHNYNFDPPLLYNATGLDVYGTISSATGSASLTSETSSACTGFVCSCTAPTCNTISMPDTIHACAGQPIVLADTVSGSDSVFSILWTPSAGLSSSSILSPTLSASASGWYHLTIQSILPENFIVNGDFSAGDTGFTSGYTFYSMPPPTGAASTPGDYFIGTNSHTYDTAWPSMGDHTTGTGNMLLIDASIIAGVSFWCETVPVIPNTNYVFSAWSALLLAPVPTIRLTINGVSIGIFSTPPIVGIWGQYQVTWNSGTATSANICMTDMSTALSGNDFALDDIFFRQLCSTEDSVYFGLIPTAFTYSSHDTSICSSVSSIVLYAPTGYSSYLWSTGDTGPSVTVGGGTYWVASSASCVSFIDTFHVNSIPVTIVTAIKDTSICAGEIILLTAPYSASSYLWSTGATGPSITEGGGIYWIASLIGCTSFVDTFHIISVPVSTVITIKDTSICSGEIIVLAVPAGDSSYLWNTGSTEPSVTADSGVYWVVYTLDCVSFIDTFRVIPMPAPTVTVFKDTTVCEGKYITLIIPGTYDSYLWSTGATTSSISVYGGTYWVVASAACSFSFDTFSVESILLPIIHLGDDTTICKGDSITLSSIQSDGAVYLWSNGDSSHSIVVSAAGTYTLTVTDMGCSASSYISIGENIKPIVSLGPDTIICSGESLLLSTNNINSPLLWNTGSTDPYITVTTTGSYWVTASNVCGSTTDTINVDFELCDIWLPLAFTPNNDGLNDAIHLLGNLQHLIDFSLSIYNRWGQRVFYTENIYDGWNGKFNGVNQDMGVYYYMLFYSLEGKQHMMKGDIELIR